MIAGIMIALIFVIGGPLGYFFLYGIPEETVVSTDGGHLLAYTTVQHAAHLWRGNTTIA